MAITKLVLDRQAAGRVFTFGSSAASADVNLAKATGDSTDVVVLNAEGSVDIAGNVAVTDSLTVTGAANLNSGLDVNNNVITNVAGPVSGSDAANKTYVDNEISTANTNFTNFSGSVATEINDLQSDVATAQDDIIALEGRMDTAESDITALEGRMDTAETDITALEGRMDTAELDITNLEGRMDTAELDIDNLQTDLSTAQTDILALDDRLDTAEGAITSLESRMDTAEGDIDTLQTDVAALQADLGDYALLSGGNTFSGDQSITGDLTVNGNISVTGTQTVINSTTLEIGDNIISLNGTGAAYAGIEVNDPTAPNTVSGSLLWDAANDMWIAGAKGAELPVLTASAGSNGQALIVVDGTAIFADVAKFRRANVSGTKDGSNKTFGMDVSDIFVADSEQVILNGIILMPGAGNDYTVSGKNIIFNVAFPAPLADDNLQIMATH
jgi:peptidoglycan hydrolase CwlO-like protein